MNMQTQKLTLVALLLATVIVAPGAAAAADCPVAHDRLQQALRQSVKASGGPGSGGLDNHEWAAGVARDGKVCEAAGSRP